MTVLKLNADYSPIQVVAWESAVELVLAEKASVIEAVPGRFVRSERLVLPWPSVIALRRYKTVKARAKFCGRNVILRDGGRCSYCGVAPRRADGTIDRTDLTLDHVVPRAQARHGAVFLPWSRKWANLSSWENATTACRSCNSWKADRTPDQAGMRLLVLPRIPTHADVLRMSLARAHTPPSWAPYLPPALLVRDGAAEGPAPLALPSAG